MAASALHAQVCSLGTNACGVQIGSSKATLKLDQLWLKNLNMGDNVTIINYLMEWQDR